MDTKNSGREVVIFLPDLKTQVHGVVVHEVFSHGLTKYVCRTDIGVITVKWFQVYFKDGLT